MVGTLFFSLCSMQMKYIWTELTRERQEAVVEVKVVQMNSDRRSCDMLDCILIVSTLMVIVEVTAFILSCLARKYPESEYFSNSSHWWNEEETVTSRASRVERSLIRTTTKEEERPNDYDLSQKSCVICLNDFKVDDDDHDDETTIVVQSAQRCCKSCYHRECLSEWLMNHSTCPCCRTTILRPL